MSPSDSFKPENFRIDGHLRITILYKKGSDYQSPLIVHRFKISTKWL